MHVLITGAAGFIGSTLAERVLLEGWRVTAVDDFDPFYAREIKERNLATIRTHDAARFLELDLARDDLAEAVDGVDAVVHLAALAGVRGSWGETFRAYLDANVLATQRLLEACRGRVLHAWIYGSSASVYGDDVREPVDEETLPAPHSPYGVTKLAGEHLAHLYRRNHGVPTLSLRYFSVYGPRERPDKAIQRFLLAALEGRAIEVLGDGSQQRDFTYVGDAIEATMTALRRRPIGETINVARGRTVSLRDVIDTVERVSGRTLEVVYRPVAPGDVRVTAAAIERAQQILDYAPQVDIEPGIRRQWAHVRWHAAPASSPAPEDA